MALTILKVGGFDMLPRLRDELEKRGEYFVDSSLAPEERKAVRARTDIVVASGNSCWQKEDFDGAPSLKAIVCFSVGYDRIDWQEAARRNVFVTHTPDVLNDDVADTAIMLMLNTMREFKATQEYVEAGKWGSAPMYPLTHSPAHRKVGIAGLGRIGSEIADRCKAFKMEIGYYGRNCKDVPYQYFDNLKDMAAWCDVMILAMPASPDNRHAVNKEVLSVLGPDGYLINIARGSIVNTADLIECLDNKVIAGAGLDVYENEPEVPKELMNRPNVALQPHTASATWETRDAMADLVLRNLDAILEGRAPVTPVPGTRTV